MTGQEPGQGFGDRSGPFDVEQMAHAFYDALLDAGHVRAEERGDLDPQRLGGAAEHGQHRLADRRGLGGAEAPLRQRGEFDPEERVGVLPPPRGCGGRRCWDTAEPDRAEPDTFVREGDHWRVVFDGRRTTVRDSKGMHHLARLFAAPGREFHVLDLVAADSDDPAAGRLSRAGDLGPLLDDRAKQMYRRRSAEIDADIEEARADNDVGRQEQAGFEREFLINELARAVGLGGRDRHAGVASERARAAVTQAVRKAIGRLRDACPALGDHLDRTISTGTYCAYAPDPRVPSGRST